MTELLERARLSELIPSPFPEVALLLFLVSSPSPVALEVTFCL
jgi:hypothetical protein